MINQIFRFPIMTYKLPPFLTIESENQGDMLPIVARFPHSEKLGNTEAHVLWWSCMSESPTVALIFIPGNPGLIEFYRGFLSSIHDQTKNDIAILAHAHLGHAPHIPPPPEQFLGLPPQVEGALEVHDAVKTTYPDTKIVLVGHSIGAWISTKVLHYRPETVDATFLLFPTLSEVAQTPNGRKVSRLCRPPFPRFISAISLVCWLIPTRLLACLFSSWPRQQITVLETLISSPTTIYACLTMADEEMLQVRELDIALIQQHRAKLWIYYAEKDNWIAEEQTKVEKAMEDQNLLGTVDRITHCRHSVPHAFSLNHGSLLGAHCINWLRGCGILE